MSSFDHFLRQRSAVQPQHAKEYQAVIAHVAKLEAELAELKATLTDKRVVTLNVEDAIHQPYSRQVTIKVTQFAPMQLFASQLIDKTYRMDEDFAKHFSNLLSKIVAEVWRREILTQVYIALMQKSKEFDDESGTV